MIKKRLIQVLENKGIAKENFYNQIGMTSASFRGKAKQTPLNSNAVANILSEITDLNPNWLLTGQGSMLKNDSSSSISQNVTGSNVTMVGGNAKIKDSNNVNNDDNLDEVKILKDELKTCKKQLKEKDQEIERLKKQVDKLFKIID